MSNGQQLSPEEQKAVIFVVGIIGVVLAILVFIITMARVVFWFSVVFFFMSFLYFIGGLIRDIYLAKNLEDFDFVAPHFLIALGLILLFWTIAHFSFPIGYSELSYKILDINEEYKETMNLPYQITLETLNQTCESMPKYAGCDNLIKTYETGQKIIQISDTAKTITTIFRLKY
jgi:hypothetical protein